MRFEVRRDPQAFAESVDRFVAGRVECNVLATVLAQVRDRRLTEAVLARGVDEHGEVRAVALRTAPWPMLCSALGPDDAAALVTMWLDHDPDLDGVNAPAETARAVAAAWQRRTGGEVMCRMRTAFHALETVTEPPRAAAGALRSGREEDRPLLSRWWTAFEHEAGVFRTDAQTEAMVESRLRAGCVWLWDGADAGPLSLVASNAPVAGVVRLGPVYTPPEYRRRGYAAAAVAAVSRRALEAGATRCTLFTDLSNPTSNKIYAEVGYRRLSDWEELDLTLPAGSSSASRCGDEFCSARASKER